jgi:hypothetical protein
MNKAPLVFRSGLTERIVRLAAEYGYITSAEVALFTKNPQTAMSLLYQLRRKELLTSFSTHLKPGFAYTLAPKAKQIVLSSGLVDFVSPFKPHMYRETMFFHDTALIKLHITFEEILGDRLKEYISGKRLVRDQKANKKICDAEMIVAGKSGDEKHFAIELELSTKSRMRFKKGVRTLAEQARGRYDALMIIYSLPTIKERWQEALKEIKSLHDIDYFFIQRDDLLANKAGCKAQDLNNKIIPLF